MRIDAILLPVIRELNNKLYRTAFSCAGYQPGEQMYITFQHWYDIDAPEGFHYSCYDFCLFRPCPNGLSDEEYRSFRQESADTLLKWAQELPECPWPDGTVRKWQKTIMVKWQRLRASTVRTMGLLI